MNLRTVIYSSRETNEISQDDVEMLLVYARAHNETVGITGLLLYFDYVFFQVLEGPEEEVRDLYERIIADDRHQDVTLHVDEAITSRLFGEWAMAYSLTDRETISQTQNVVEFFQRKSSRVTNQVLSEEETRRVSMISLVAKSIAA